MRRNGVGDDQQWERLKKRISNVRPQQAPGRAAAEHTQNPSTSALNPVQKPQNSPETTKKINLSLSLSLPNIKRIKISKRNKKIAVGLTSIAILAGAGLISSKLISNSKTDDPKDVLSETIIEPEFDVVLPNGKKEETQGNKLGYDPDKKVASFKDTVGTSEVIVSQQPLPEAFEANPDEEVRKIAEGFSAREVINESNPKAYLGNSVKGPQTVIFHKKGLLIFIFSNKPIETDMWADYITRLL